jgi:flagellar L-ring protein precursor FlgH
MSNSRLSALAVRTIAIGALSLLLSACSAVNRITQIGVTPELAPIQNPVKKPGYRSISMPMPDAQRPLPMANSLWRPGSRAFFKDQRARRVGDIVTVSVAISDTAEIDNSTTRTRTNSEDADMTSMFGYENQLSKILPEGVNPNSLVSLGSSSKSIGSGEVDRSETITMTIAAVVTQILPNGNMVIWGHQEVRVNFEVRELMVDGVIRPEDISSSNTIKHTQIAEARIAYGGRGQLTDVQQPRYGQQVLDIILPF